MSGERIAVVFLVGIGLCATAFPADSPAGSKSAGELADEAFFEFLGSWDGEEDDLQEFFDSAVEFESDLPADSDSDNRNTDSDSE